MARATFGLPINMLDNFEAELAAERWNGFPVPLVPHDFAVQIAEAVGDTKPEPYEGLKPYDGLRWNLLCPECGDVLTERTVIDGAPAYCDTCDREVVSGELRKPVWWAQDPGDNGDAEARRAKDSFQEYAQQVDADQKAVSLRELFSAPGTAPAVLTNQTVRELVEAEESENYRASFYGQQAAKRIQWITEADFTNSLNGDLFPHWQREAVRYAIAAAHEATRKGGA